MKEQNNLQETIDILQADYKKLVYAVSHDLQSPLRVMDGHIHMLNAKIGNDEKLSMHIKELQNNLQQTKNYLQGLIDYSRTIHSEISAQEFSINDLLEVIKYELRDKIKDRQAAISMSVQGTFHADKALTKKLLTHLLDNAIKFQPADQQPIIQIEAKHSTLSIQDNGIGFDSKFKDRALELFRTLHSQKDYPGNGLGLAICKKIVDMHAGTIDIESEEGKGCLVKVSL